jgi:exonuclease V gamma subunit
MNSLSDAVFSNSLDYLATLLIRDIVAIRTENLHIATVIVPDALTRSWLVQRTAFDGSISLLRFQVVTPQEVLTHEGCLTKHALYPLLFSFFAQNNPDESLEAIQEMTKKWILPFSLRTFLDDTSWFRGEEEEEMWQKFAMVSPYAQLPEGAHQEVPHFLFGFSSIHPILLHRLNFYNLQRLYLLSPCALFWEDIPTDREMKKLLSIGSRLSQEALEELLYDRQRFLANTGYLGRQFARLIEDENIQTKSCYLLPELLTTISPYKEFVHEDAIIPIKNHSVSLLDHLKADLLLLHNRTEKRDIPKDPTIEIHSAYTPLREVEALFEYLAKIYNNSPIPPASVLVLAQDPFIYKTPFEQVFGSVRFHIMGSSAHHAKSPKIFLFMLLSALPTKGSRQTWIQLVRHEVFHHILGVSSEESSILINWLRDLPTDCCLSSKSRAHYLVRRGIMPCQKNKKHNHRDEIVDAFFGHEVTVSAKDTAIISRLLFFLESIEAKWALPLDDHALLPMEFWSSLLEFFIEQIISFESPETESVAKGFADFQKVTTAAPHCCLCFHEMMTLMFDLIEANLSSNANLLAPILVAPLGSFQPVPSNVIAILGAQEGTFPEYSQEKLLLRLDRLVPGVPPSNEMLDRYSFIEAILSSSHLFVSYQAYDFATKESIFYSPVVADLLLHLDSNYTICGAAPSKTLVTKHLLHKQKEKEKSFENCLPDCRTKKKEERRTIEIRDLQKLARDPIEYFYRHQYGVVPSYQKKPSIFVRPWKVKEHLKASLGSETVQKSPVSFFAEYEYKMAEKEAKDTLRNMNISSLQRYDLHLIPTVLSGYVDQQQMFSPAISFEDGSCLVGTWQGLHDKGMLLLEETWKKELFYRWPECLLRSVLASKQLPIQEKIIILQYKKEVVFSLDSQTSLEHRLASWVEFATLAKRKPFPFTYDIVHMLVNESKDVVEAIHNLAETEKENAFWIALIKELPFQDFSLWKEWACKLWSDYFAFVEEDREL